MQPQTQGRGTATLLINNQEDKRNQHNNTQGSPPKHSYLTQFPRARDCFLSGFVRRYGLGFQQLRFLRFCELVNLVDVGIREPLDRVCLGTPAFFIAATAATFSSGRTRVGPF